MVVDVDIEQAGVTLTGPDDFTGFHVSARVEQEEQDVQPVARLDAVLRATQTGACEGPSDAMVRIDAVRRMAGRTDAGWETGFGAMLDFARTKGWLSEDGEAIRAHVEWD